METSVGAKCEPELPLPLPVILAPKFRLSFKCPDPLVNSTSENYARFCGYQIGAPFSPGFIQLIELSWKPP